MATLADVIKKRRSTGQSRTGSLFGSLTDKLKESIDPRKFINQTGVLTALFPSLKAYKAKGLSSENNTKLVPDLKNKNAAVERINRNTSIFAKNTMVLTSLGRDMNVARQNISKIVSITGIKPSDKADMFFQKSAESEKLYEYQVNKNKSSKVEALKAPEKKKGFNWMKILGVIGGIGVVYLIVDFFNKKEKSIVSEIYEQLSGTIEEFKDNIKSMTDSSFEDIKSGTDKMYNSIVENSEKLYSDFSDSFSLKNVEELFESGKSIATKFEESVEGFKSSLLEGISNVSIIPSAQASTLPSMMQTPNKPGAATGASGMSGNEQEAMKFFINKGWSPEQSAGIVGNLIHESNLNTQAYNAKENAQGIAQWRNERVQEFEKKYGKSVRSASFREQLEFVNWELNNTHKTAGEALKKTTTPQQAAVVVDKLYEVSAGTEINHRINNSNSVLASYNAPPSNSPIRISDRFGLRTHPLTGKGGVMHHGVDIAAPSGSPIYAVAGGTITAIGDQNGYGKTITIDHGDGTVSLYAHQSGFADGLILGSKVTKGQLIGYVGNSGVSTGPHLHFELRYNGKAINPGDDMAMSALVKLVSSLNPSDKKDSLALEQMSRVEMDGQQVATKTIIAPMEKIVYVSVDNSFTQNTPKTGNKFVDNMIQMVS